MTEFRPQKKPNNIYIFWIPVMAASKKYGIQRVNMLTCQHAGRVNILAISPPYMCHKSSHLAKN